jgi:hypothetical protein
MNLMSPSPEFDLDCQLCTSGVETDWKQKFPSVQAADCEQSLVSSLTNEETNTLSKWPGSQRDKRLH